MMIKETAMKAVYSGIAGDQQLMDQVLETIAHDILCENTKSLEILLRNLSVKDLVAYLPDKTWG